MTPAEKIGYKIGDKFVVSGSFAFTDDSIVELEYDDGSKSPLFKLINGGCKYNNARNGLAGAYCALDFVKIKENKMTSHKHAKLIKAKADNMELVLFAMSTGSNYGKLTECNRNTFPKDNENINYFLCLPKHKEACLHWLNGGEIQILDGNSWDDCDPHLGGDQTWFIDWFLLMNNGCDFRIKPRKEKRWILINKALNRVYNELYDYQPKNQNGWVSHEIEVEV